MGTECTWLPAIEIDVGGGFGAIDQARAKRLALGGLNGSLVKIVKRFGRVSGHNVGEKLNVTIVAVKVRWCGRRDQTKVNVPRGMELILSSFRGQQGNKNNKNYGNKCNDDQLENNLSTVVDSDVGQQKSMQKEIQPEQFPDSENDNDDGLLGKLVNCTGGNGDRRDFKIFGSQHWFQCDGQRRFSRTFGDALFDVSLGRVQLFQGATTGPYKSVHGPVWVHDVRHG